MSTNEQADGESELGFGFLASWPSDARAADSAKTRKRAVYPRFQIPPNEQTNGRASQSYGALCVRKPRGRGTRSLGGTSVLLPALPQSQAGALWEEVALVALGVSGMAGIVLAFV